MGNYLTCVAPFAHPPCITVVHAVTAEVQEIHEPVKVAELMLESPGHFVCHSSSFRSGHRISPLSADQELQPTQLYFIFPMSRLHTLLTEQEKDFLGKLLSGSKGEKVSGRLEGRITPWRENSHSIDKTKGEPGSETETVVMSFRTTRSFSARQGSLAEDAELSAQLMLARCRSWRPNLQTISEISSLKG